MPLMMFLSILVLIILGTFFILGRKYSESIKQYLQVHPMIPKAVLWGYVIFAGCFVFPIRSEPFPLDFSKAYLLVASYGVIGLGFAGLYGRCRGKTVYFFALVLTVAGMICRYVLEYGEVSNSYNFTFLNVASYIILIPVFTVFVYELCAGLVKKHDE